MTPFDLAQRFIGIREIPGDDDHPFIVFAHSLAGLSDAHDETPWCGSVMTALCFILDLTVPETSDTTHPARARSWLTVGRAVDLSQAKTGHDVVILMRGGGNQPGPEVLKAPGHVGLYAGMLGDKVLILAGNQSDAWNIQAFPTERILGIRRLI